MTLFHTLSKWLPTILSPLGLTLIALIAALFIRNRPRLQSTLMVAALVCLWGFGMPTTSRWLITSLEARYPAPMLDTLAPADLTILLGGGVNLPDAVSRRAQLGPSGDRVALVAELWHAGLTDRVLISGGTLAPKPGVEPEARHTADLLIRWGVTPGAIEIEGESGTTFENARFSAQMLDRRPSGTARIFLVTSAMHLPRARALFCRAGVETIGMPANRWVDAEPSWFELGWLPNATSLRGSSEALREWLGIVVYAALDRLDTGALRHDRPCTSHQA